MPHSNKAFRLGKFDLLLFNQELVSLLEAGLTIIEALETLISKETNLHVKDIVIRVLGSLKEGNPLSTALAANKEYFPDLYIASIKSSEKTGGLSEAIKKYVAYQNQVELIKKKIISASIYPVMLMIVGGLVIFFLLGYVVPKFSHIFTESGRELPFASKVLIEFGNFVGDHGGALLLLLVTLIAFLIYLSRLPVSRGKLKQILWNLPVLGDKIKTYQLSRFYRSLGMLVGAGIPIVQALEQTASLLEQQLSSALQNTIRLVKEGQPLSASASQNQLITPVAFSLIRVGEKTGQMAKMLEKTADFHDEEINRWLEWFTKLLEPVLMTVIGVIVGAIVVLMYLPIFELAGNIQ